MNIPLAILLENAKTAVMQPCGDKSERRPEVKKSPRAGSRQGMQIACLIRMRYVCSREFINLADDLSGRAVGVSIKVIR